MAMDELTIDDRKFISSKRAAEITGYAKDYVGQLAREGYVEARRVGRNWYVLESAIRDHRTGSEEIQTLPAAAQSDETADTSKPESDAYPKAWSVEVPHYEADETPVLPSVNKLKNEEPLRNDPPHAVAPTEDFPAAWQAWFDAFKESTPPTHTPAATASSQEVVAPQESSLIEENLAPTHQEPEPEAERHEEVQRIPLILAPEQQKTHLAPRPPAQQPVYRAGDIGLSRERKGGNTALRVLSILFIVVLFAACAGITLIGSGKVDRYLISYNRVLKISGINYYIKSSK